MSKENTNTPKPLGDAGPASTGYVKPNQPLGGVTPAQHVGPGADGIPPALPKGVGGL